MNRATTITRCVKLIDWELALNEPQPLAYFVEFFKNKIELVVGMAPPCNSCGGARFPAGRPG